MTPTLEIGAAQLRSVTEIAPKSPSLCVNRSPIQYGFCAGAKAFRYSVNTFRICESPPTLLIRAARHCSVTVAEPKSVLMCEQKPCFRYGFRAGAKAFRYSVNIGLNYLVITKDFALPMSMRRKERNATFMGLSSAS